MSLEIKEKFKKETLEIVKVTLDVDTFQKMKRAGGQAVGLWVRNAINEKFEKEKSWKM